MLSNLYRETFATKKMQIVSAAIHRADAVAEEKLLTQQIENIASELSVSQMEFARLKPEERYGKRMQSRIEVYIPFDGKADSLFIQPSKSVEIRTSTTLHGHNIKAVFPDDDNLDDNVDRLIDSLNTNLRNLQQEWPLISKEAREGVLKVLQRRRATIEAQKARDRTRKFPID